MTEQGDIGNGQSRGVDDVRMPSPHPHFNGGLNPAKANTTMSQDVDPVKALSFPAKLHSILSRRDLSDVISWMPHGRSWKVHQPETFEREVVPRFFVSCKYSSFIRQANGWGFRRITKGPDRNSYYHEHFLRGRLHLCGRMRRAAPKEKKEPSGGTLEDQQPDFYKMSEEDPLPEIGEEENEDGDGVRDAEGNAKKKMSNGGEFPDSATSLMNARANGEGRCVVLLQEAAAAAASAAAAAVSSATADEVSLAGLDDALAKLESAEGQCRAVADAIRAVKRAAAAASSSVGRPADTASSRLQHIEELASKLLPEVGRPADTASSGLQRLEGLAQGLRPRVGRPPELGDLSILGGCYAGRREQGEKEGLDRVAVEVSLALSSAAATSSRSVPPILAPDLIRRQQQQLLSSSSLASGISFEQQQHRYPPLSLSTSSSSYPPLDRPSWPR